MDCEFGQNSRHTINFGEKQSFTHTDTESKNYSVTLQPYCKQYCFNFAKQKPSMIFSIKFIAKIISENET